MDISCLQTLLNGVDARLTYDDALISLLDILPGDGDGSAWDAAVVSIDRNSNGLLDFNAQLTGPGHCAIEQGAMVRMKFVATAPGMTNLAFRPDEPPAVTRLSGCDSMPVAPQRFDGANFDIETGFSRRHQRVCQWSAAWISRHVLAAHRSRTAGR